MLKRFIIYCFCASAKKLTNSFLRSEQVFYCFSQAQNSKNLLAPKDIHESTLFFACKKTVRNSDVCFCRVTNFIQAFRYTSFLLKKHYFWSNM